MNQSLSFKILTLNTHKGFTTFNRRFMLHELRDAVRSVSADIVFLQEVLGANELHPNRVARWPVQPQYEFLADSIWADHAYGKNAVYPAGHHGNAVLSKFQIVSSQNRDVSITGPERRGLLHCAIRVPGHDLDIHVICAHLGLIELHRRQQLELMCEFIRNNIPDDAPLLIAGDFNDWRVRAHDILARGAGLKEVFVEYSGRTARTFPARWPFLCLDRIYYRNLRVIAPTVLSARPWSHLSDHAALSAEIRL